MCIAVIAIGAHPRWPLLIAANRDEFHVREAAPLHRWDNGIIGGKDLRGGGTWLGLHEAGRLVLVTNYRVPGYPQPERPSRGGLVSGLLLGDNPQSVPIGEYNPFNLVYISRSEATLLSNYPVEQRRPLPPGIHGVSNGAFDPPWPKTMKLRGHIADWLDGDGDDFDPLFAALADPSQTATTERGPEQKFSGVFIRDETYGTRNSTIVALDSRGRGRIIERSFSKFAEVTGQVAVDFAWPAGRSPLP